MSTSMIIKLFLIGTPVLITLAIQCAIEVFKVIRCSKWVKKIKWY